MTEQGVLIDVPPHAGNDDENWRFTSPEADLWLRSIAGVDKWDLDPFACHEAHLAERYYTLERGEDGYTLPWFGAVGYNPPWDNIEPAVARSWSAETWANHAVDDKGAYKVISDRPAVRVIAALLPLRTHMGWWKKWVAPYRDQCGECGTFSVPDIAGGFRVRLEMHEAPKRFAYGGPGNPRAIGVAEPNFQSVGLVWRATW